MWDDQIMKKKVEEFGREHYQSGDDGGLGLEAIEAGEGGGDGGDTAHCSRHVYQARSDLGWGYKRGR